MLYRFPISDGMGLNDSFRRHLWNKQPFRLQWVVNLECCDNITGFCCVIFQFCLTICGFKFYTSSCLFMWCKTNWTTDNFTPVNMNIALFISQIRAPCSSHRAWLGLAKKVTKSILSRITNRSSAFNTNVFSIAECHGIPKVWIYLGEYRPWQAKFVDAVYATRTDLLHVIIMPSSCRCVAYMAKQILKSRVLTYR